MSATTAKPLIEERTLSGVTKANLIEALFGKGFMFATRKKNSTVSSRESIKITKLEQEDGSASKWNFTGLLQNENQSVLVSGFVNIGTGQGHLKIEW